MLDKTIRLNYFLSFSVDNPKVQDVLGNRGSVEVTEHALIKRDGGGFCRDESWRNVAV